MGKRLLKPIEKWPAFDLRLIDKEGKVIRKPKTDEEKNALTILDRFLLQIKSLVKPRNLMLFSVLFLLKDSLDWEDIHGSSDEQLIEKVKNNIRVKEVLNKFKDDIDENFESEDDFWREFLKIRIDD